MNNHLPKALIFFLIISFSAPVSAQSQFAAWYFDGGVVYNTFTNAGKFEIDKNITTPTFRFGYGFYLGQKQKFKLSHEIGYTNRQFHKEYRNLTGMYRFIGFQTNFIFTYSITKNLEIAAGPGIFLYQSTYREEGRFKDLGSGAQNADVLLIAGLNYQIFDILSIGARFNYGLLPMLKSAYIGDFGERGQIESSLNLSAGELFLRFNF